MVKIFVRVYVFSCFFVVVFFVLPVLVKSESVHSQGKQLCHFHACLPSQWCLICEGMNLFLNSSFKSRPFLGRDLLSKETNRKSQKLSPYLKKKGSTHTPHWHSMQCSR